MNGPAEEAYWNLVAAARAEDGIAPDERKVLNAYVLKLGLDGARAREIQAAAEAENPPRIRIPKDGKGRLDTLRAVLEVAAADGSVAPKELAVIKALGERCAIRPDTLNRLLAVAMRKSADQLDKAFAALKSAGDAGPELVEFAGAIRGGPNSPLRSIPFAARLAPAEATCADCGFRFGDRNAYARYCRVCRVNHGVRNLTGGRIETLFGLCFLLLLVPAGFLVEGATGLWSWGWHAGDTASYRRKRGLVLMLPAFGATALLAALAAWGISALIARLLRDKVAPR